MGMTMVHSEGGYGFFIGLECGVRVGFRSVWNIVKLPTTIEEKMKFKVGGGYLNRRYIEKIKGLRFPDRYQPTLHGMGELYTFDNPQQRSE